MYQNLFDNRVLNCSHFSWEYQNSLKATDEVILVVRDWNILLTAFNGQWTNLNIHWIQAKIHVTLSRKGNPAFKTGKNSFSIEIFKKTNNLLGKLVWARNLVLPRTEIHFSIAVDFDSHVLPCYFVVFGSFYIPKKCIWCPNQLGSVPCHVEWSAKIVRQPWINPPLTKEDIHCVFLSEGIK